MAAATFTTCTFSSSMCCCQLGALLSLWCCAGDSLHKRCFFLPGLQALLLVGRPASAAGLPWLACSRLLGWHKSVLVSSPASAAVQPPAGQSFCEAGLDIETCEGPVAYNQVHTGLSWCQALPRAAWQPSAGQWLCKAGLDTETRKRQWPVVNALHRIGLCPGGRPCLKSIAAACRLIDQVSPWAFEAMPVVC